MVALLAGLSLLFALAAAQSPTLTLPFYGYDTMSIAASVINVDNGVTTMQLACPPTTDESDCGLFPSQVLTYGPSTYHMYLAQGTDTAEFVGTQDCSRAGTTSAICTESDTGSSANFPGMSTATYVGTDIDYLPVVVTGGADRLTSGTVTTGSSLSGPTSSASSRASLTTLTATNTATGPSTPTSASASQSGSANTGSSAAASFVISWSATIAGLGGMLGMLLMI